MRTRPTTDTLRPVVACVVALQVVLVGCGGPSAEERAAERARFTAARTSAEAARADAEEQLAEAADAEVCRAELGPFLESLEELNSRLSVGLTFQNYSEEVGNVRVAYDQVEFSNLSLACTSRAGLAAEKALNA